MKEGIFKKSFLNHGDIHGKVGKHLSPEKRESALASELAVHQPIYFFNLPEFKLDTLYVLSVDKMYVILTEKLGSDDEQHTTIMEVERLVKSLNEGFYKSCMPLLNPAYLSKMVAEREFNSFVTKNMRRFNEMSLSEKMKVDVPCVSDMPMTHSDVLEQFFSASSVEYVYGIDNSLYLKRYLIQDMNNLGNDHSTNNLRVVDVMDSQNEPYHVYVEKDSIELILVLKTNNLVEVEVALKLLK